jgi:uncharacterized membrane protein YqjE
MRRAARPGLRLVASRRNSNRVQRQAEPSRREAAPAPEIPDLAEVGQELGGVFAAARRVAWNYIDLITLEARRAGMALMWLATWGVVAALLLASGWLALLGAASIWAVAQGFTWTQSLLTVALVNVAIAAAVIFLVGTRLSRHLLFPATRRQLARRLDQDNEDKEEGGA